MQKRSRFKKLFVVFGIIVLFLFIAALTNPTTDDFLEFEKSPLPENARVAEANFYFFSIYAIAPTNTTDEFGIVHLGFMGHFFTVADHQYDDSIWKNFLK